MVGATRRMGARGEELRGRAAEIRRVLGGHGIADRALQGAIEVAGEQIEYLELLPFPRGTIVTVIADGSRSVVLYMTDRLSEFEEIVEEFLAEHEEWRGGGQASSIGMAVSALEEHGVAPGLRPVLGLEANAVAEVGMWAGLPVEVREAVRGVMEGMIGRGICPVAICLIGLPVRDRLLAIWPLVLPLGEYRTGAWLH